MTKIDEGITTLSEFNIKNCIERIQREIDIPISDEEIQYYRDHHIPSPIQIQLVYSYFAEYFTDYRDLNLLNRRDYLHLLLLLKKKLLIEAGYDEKENKFTDAILPYILTGNLEEKVSTRMIRNNKFISKIESNYMYQQLVEKKYKHLQELKKDYILQVLSSIINTNFTYVVYEEPEMLGKPIVYNEDKISDELLFFLKCI